MNKKRFDLYRDVFFYKKSLNLSYRAQSRCNNLLLDFNFYDLNSNFKYLKS